MAGSGVPKILTHSMKVVRQGFRESVQGVRSLVIQWSIVPDALGAKLQAVLPIQSDGSLESLKHGDGLRWMPQGSEDLVEQTPTPFQAGMKMLLPLRFEIVHPPAPFGSLPGNPKPSLHGIQALLQNSQAGKNAPALGF
jgi:hypothetical protein